MSIVCLLACPRKHVHAFEDRLDMTIVVDSATVVSATQLCPLRLLIRVFDKIIQRGKAMHPIGEFGWRHDDMRSIFGFLYLPTQISQRSTAEAKNSSLPFSDGA